MTTNDRILLASSNSHMTQMRPDDCRVCVRTIVPASDGLPGIEVRSDWARETGGLLAVWFWDLNGEPLTVSNAATRFAVALDVCRESALGLRRAARLARAA